MSHRIELLQLTNLNTMGHMFCQDCAVELNITLGQYIRYKNPRYNVDWETPWNEFHNVIFVYPELLKILWDENFKASCPCCGNNETSRITPLDHSAFDLRLIERSFKEDLTHVCTACEGLFVEQCMYQTRNGYVCDDCIACAEK